MTTKLDVFLRTCDNHSIHESRSATGKRIIPSDKPTLIKKCFVSLCDSIVNAGDIDVKIWIYDDHSSDETKDYLRKVCKDRGLEYILHELEEKGPNNSAIKQFESCRDNGREWTYCVEDDFLHYPNAISEFISMGNKFKQMTGRPIAIRPDDDPFSYARNTAFYSMPSLIMLGNDRHWKTTQHTTNTIFVDSSVYRDYYEVFHILAKYFGVLGIMENDSINKLWNDGLRSQGPVPLFSPIPSLAMHISYDNEPPFTDFMALWDSIQI